MQCSIKESSGRTVIVVDGDLDNEHAAKAFRDTLNEILISGKKHAVIDMSLVECINSYGIGKLLLFYKKVLPGLAWVGVCAKMVIQRGDDHGRYRAVSVFIRVEVPVEC